MKTIKPNTQQHNIKYKQTGGIKEYGTKKTFTTICSNTSKRSF